MKKKLNHKVREFASSWKAYINIFMFCGFSLGTLFLFSLFGELTLFRLVILSISIIVYAFIFLRK